MKSIKNITRLIFAMSLLVRTPQLLARVDGDLNVDQVKLIVDTLDSVNSNKIDEFYGQYDPCTIGDQPVSAPESESEKESKCFSKLTEASKKVSECMEAYFTQDLSEKTTPAKCKDVNQKDPAEFAASEAYLLAKIKITESFKNDPKMANDFINNLKKNHFNLKLYSVDPIDPNKRKDVKKEGACHVLEVVTKKIKDGVGPVFSQTLETSFTQSISLIIEGKKESDQKIKQVYFNLFDVRVPEKVDAVKPAVEKTKEIAKENAKEETKKETKEEVKADEKTNPDSSAEKNKCEALNEKEENDEKSESKHVWDDEKKTCEKVDLTPKEKCEKLNKNTTDDVGRIINKYKWDESKKGCIERDKNETVNQDKDFDEGKRNRSGNEEAMPFVDSIPQHPPARFRPVQIPTRQMYILPGMP